MEEHKIHNVERRITLAPSARSWIMCISTERVERIQSITCDYLDPAIIMLIIEELKIHHVFSGKYIAYSTKIDLLDYALIVFCLSGPTIKHLGQNPQPSPSPNIPLYSPTSVTLSSPLPKPFPHYQISPFPSGAPA